MSCQMFSLRKIDLRFYFWGTEHVAYRLKALLILILFHVKFLQTLWA